MYSKNHLDCRGDKDEVERTFVVFNAPRLSSESGQWDRWNVLELVYNNWIDVSDKKWEVNDDSQLCDFGNGEDDVAVQLINPVM